MKFSWILDAGHGGVNANGVYTTDPKIGKRCDYPDGFTILEGVINRAILRRVVQRLTFLEVDFAIVSDDVADVSLGERCRRTNAIHAKANKRTIFLSLHSNAGGGRGFEVFTSVGQDFSDDVATLFCDEIARAFPNFPLRQDKDDGDPDKEANFYVLRPDHNHASARVLLENLFFDTRSEADYLASEQGQQRIADYICAAIIRTENNL